MPRPNPTQHRGQDDREVRQLMYTMLPPGLALDARQAEWMMNESNQRSWAIAWRRAALRLAWERHAPELTITPEQRRELEAYVLEGGELPSWAQRVAPDGSFGLSAAELGAARPELPAAAEPSEDPEEPGRYVRPAGRFAQPGSEEFRPDPR